MMKKKVKKIPKYEKGTPTVKPYVDDFSFSNSIGEHWQNMSGNAKANAVAGGIGAVGTMVSNATSGQKVTAGGVISGMGSGAAAGAAIGGPWGAVAGGILGGVTSAVGSGASYDSNSNSTSFNDIYQLGSGIASLFDDEHAARIGANMVQNNNIAKVQTEQLRAKYAMNPNNSNGGKIMAAEGGIMRKPVDALISKGELIYNPVTKKLSQVPGSKGKPNKADDVYARLYEGDVVISNSPTMLMSNGKTPAQNLMGMVDKYSTGGTVKAREAIIKKVVNWQEVNKTKPQEYAKFDGGGIAGINKYGYNKNMSDFAYWDKDKNEYKKEYLDWVNNLTEQDVRDIEAGKYGDMTEYFSKNKGKKLDVATAQKLMTDKKYGNWHKIGQAVVDNKIKNTEPKLAEPWQAKMSINGVGPLWQDMSKSNYPIDYTVTPIDMKLKTLPNPSEADGIIAAYKAQNKGKGTPDWLSNITDFAPMAAALFGDYDYHTEQAQISPAKYIPTGVSIDPIRRAADESYAMARYNQANISPNTGAGMAYGLQAASNRTKSLADAYIWQQDAQNKLIAQNAGIYNDWAKRYDAARYQAIADTRANEGAAQQMRDQAIKDAYEFQTGRRNDRWKLSMLEPMLQYAVDDKIWKKMKI